MARDQVAGALILDRLREQIVSGLYLRYWSPGDRLPSIREVATMERVDRKTAAAAYRRLQEEGIVRVRSRSGIYLSSPLPPEAAGPLDRLHRQWLEHTYEGARALGLDTTTILRLINAIAEVERVRIPVVECDWAQAEAIAAELRERLQVRAMPYVLEEVRSGEPVLAEAPVIVTTPYHTAELALLAPKRPIVEATLAPEVLRDLGQRAANGRVVVVAASTALAGKLQRALEHSQIPLPQIQIIAAAERGEVATAAAGASSVFLWPGTPEWVEEALPPGLAVQRPARSIADDVIRRIQTAILDAAIRRFKTAPASGGLPTATAVRAEEARVV